MPKTYSFANDPKTTVTVYANDRMLPTWLAVLVRTWDSFSFGVMTPFAVSYLQLGMLSGCCFHTLDLELASSA